MKYSEKFMSKKEEIQSKSVSIGFDGFVDYVIRPVQTRIDEKTCSYFPTIGDFGDKIKSLAGISGNIELIINSTDFGGCGPHYANGLANMGVSCTCVGALGYPEKNSVFNLNEKCKTITVSEPGYSYVFEFGDGKIIMSDVEKISQLRWNDLIERISVEEIVKHFEN